MKRLWFTALAGFMLMSLAFGQVEIYKRTLINVPAAEGAGFGNFVAGVDLDGDGKTEVYAVNNNWDDSPNQLIPRVYKYERNGSGGWDQVWMATMSIPKQNTWPTLCVSDLDGDGKKEITWGPVNFTEASTNENPSRIIVFESVAGKDTLGVPDGSGGYKPNTQWTITNTNLANIRPFKMQAWDFDKDGKSELVFSDRANSIYRFAVVGVSGVPDNGDTAGVVWSFKYQGLASNTNINTGTYYDLAIVDSTIFFFNTNGNSQAVTYDKGTYTLRTAQLGIIPGGSWKTSAVANLDGAGSNEILIGGWTSTAANKKIRVLQKTNDSTLTEAVAIDVSAAVGAGQIYGGVAGDVDNDGKTDYAFGTRDGGSKVFRLEYQGGGLATAGNYNLYEIDRGIVATATRIDEFAMANVDTIAGDEVFYSSSVDGLVPIVQLSEGKKAVNVTFVANTAGVPDTLKANSFVQIRGGAAQITWGMDSPAKMTNFGTALNPSDYWKYTGMFPEGASFNYKFYTNAKSSIAAAQEHEGWEGNVSVSNNDRPIVVGSNDTTLPVQYVNGFAEKPGQFAAPFPTGKTDTVVAYLRVNMQSFESFNPAIHKVGVRGSFAASAWGTSLILTPEAPHNNGGSRQYTAENFYSIPIYWVKSLLDTPSAEKTMRFKFVIHNKNAPNNEDWGLMVDNPDYQIEFPMPKKDTTVTWRWYRGVPFAPPLGKDTVTLSFRSDLSTAIAQKGFKPGDTLIVRYGYSSSASQVYTDTLKKVGFSGNIYQTANRVVVGVTEGKKLLYQYYLTKDLGSNEFREVFYDFDYSGSSSSEAERRKLDIVTKNTTMTVADTSVSLSSMRRRPVFQNTGKLAQNVAVTFTCDLRPAYYTLQFGDSLFDVQSAFRTIVPADKDSVYNWGVWMNGPAVGGWSNPAGGDWGNALRSNLNKKMYDDGTHGDAVAGDHIYSLAVQFYKDSANNTIGQIFKFGLNAGDNEGGKGGFGNNHVRNIDDSQPTAVVAEQFGSINPKYYRFWDYDKGTVSVGRDNDIVPLVYQLHQNYPNPFNPTTSIKYAIPTDGMVTLKIYNILGQEVLTLVNEPMSAGSYTAVFNASHLASGTYIYRIQSGSFTAVKKMMLLK